MSVDIERLADAGMKCVHKMDREDMLALKLCLLSTGALAGLSFRGPPHRRPGLHPALRRAGPAPHRPLPGRAGGHLARRAHGLGRGKLTSRSSARSPPHGRRPGIFSERSSCPWTSQPSPRPSGPN